MNRSFIVAVLTVTMIYMMSTGVYAASAPHNFDCDNCHGKHMGSGVVAATTGCLGCHSPTGEAARMPIDSGALSNYFGSIAGQPSTGSRSAHTWGAASPKAAASAQEPTTAILNAPTLDGNSITGSVSCVRCHSTKRPNTYKPFLRATNLNDALCLDCHRSRKTTSTEAYRLLGSHPVQLKAYSTVYKYKDAFKNNTTAFRKTPLSPNPNNRTAKLGNYFDSTGKIVCTTCHAPHYADSNSATLDNRSTANGFALDDPAKGLKGQLQNSKGQLLRTDPFGATADAINICSSCHKETANLNHNGRGQNIQCNHCHAAHVDYNADGSKANLYLVRRDFSGMSTAKIKLDAKNVIYSSAASLRFARTDNKGICQICHTPTPGVAIHDVADTYKQDCIVCHTHANGFAAASCTSCHGYPPVTNVVGGPNGKAQDYTLNESATPHAIHAGSGYYKYACKNCHYDGNRIDKHNTATKTFADVFVDTAGSIGVVAGFPNTPSHYDSGTRTCSNVYCHSNGNPRTPTGNSISWKSSTTPSWQNGSTTGKILGTVSECITCHDNNESLNTNAHFVHVKTNSINCIVCHASTVNFTGAIIDTTKHANGIKDVAFVLKPKNYQNDNLLFSGSYNSENATCTNSCHTNGLGGSPNRAAVWTESGYDCSSCHLAVPDTSGHPAHFIGATGPKLGPAPDCTSCHIYTAGATTHANGERNLKPVNSCDPCHPAAAGTPNWFAVSVTCESCHTGVASVVLSHGITYDAPLKSLNGHYNYSTASLPPVKCTTCHNAAADHIGAADTEKRLLVSVTCASCHTTSSGKGLPAARIDMLNHGAGANPPPATDAFRKYTTANDSRASQCSGCHDTHGTSNLSGIRTEINGHPIVYTDGPTGLYVSSTSNGIYNGLCQVCHTKTLYFRNNVDPDLGSLAHTQGDLNCLHCHLHKPTLANPTIEFAFQATDGGCGGCHGYPPARSEDGLKTIANYSSAKLQSYSGGGGAHTVTGHLPRTIRQGEKWNNCTNCHYGNSATHNQGKTPITIEKRSYVNVIVDPKFKFRNDTSITYNSNASTCSNVSCHFKPTPNWTNGL